MDTRRSVAQLKNTDSFLLKILTEAGTPDYAKFLNG